MKYYRCYFLSPTNAIKDVAEFEDSSSTIAPRSNTPITGSWKSGAIIRASNSGKARASSTMTISVKTPQS